MKILVTGATGLVGSELVSELHENGYSVNYLTTQQSKIRTEEGYHGFLWNPKTQEIDLNALDDVVVIVNLAGASIAKRWTPARKKEVLDSRINSIRTLRKGIEQSKKNKVQHIINASAIGIYPNSDSSFYDETFQGVDNSFLGEVVAQWEQEADTFKNLNISVAKVRIGLVLSAHGGALPQIALPIKSYVGAVLGSGDQWQSWIHINDLARLFVFVLENRSKGVYNGVAPNPVTHGKFTKELAVLLKRPLFLPKIPKWAIRLLLGEMAYLLLVSHRVSCKKIEEKGFIFKYTNICKALEGIYLDGKEQLVPQNI